MLLDVNKTQALKLKKIVDSAIAPNDLSPGFSIIAFSQLGLSFGDNVAFYPRYIDYNNKQIILQAVDLSDYQEQYLTGVVKSDAGSGKESFYLNGLNVSGKFFDVDINEQFAVVRNNSWSVGTHLSKNLTVQTSASYWIVSCVFNGFALLKNNASGGGGGGGTAETITFISNVSVTSDGRLAFTFTTKSVLVE